MKTSGNIECPVDFVMINENQARLNALQTLAWVIIWFISGYFIIPALLAIDFLLRATNQGKYSPLNILSNFLIKRFAVANKPVDRAPKRFAAWLGFFFSAAIAILSVLGLGIAAEIVASLLLTCAALEAFANFCVGCHVYTFLISFRLRIDRKASS
jgi:hypothetical protein